MVNDQHNYHHITNSRRQQSLYKDWRLR
uniref:Uncharacterized protein n=1 Tax=Tetranychus urticae TaxID=32264 RepID=T1KBT1_TETUR